MPPEWVIRGAVLADPAISLTKLAEITHVSITRASSLRGRVRGTIDPFSKDLLLGMTDAVGPAYAHGFIDRLAGLNGRSLPLKHLLPELTQRARAALSAGTVSSTDPRDVGAMVRKMTKVVLRTAFRPDEHTLQQVDRQVYYQRVVRGAILRDPSISIDELRIITGLEPNTTRHLANNVLGSIQVSGKLRKSVAEVAGEKVMLAFVDRLHPFFMHGGVFGFTQLREEVQVLAESAVKLTRSVSDVTGVPAAQGSAGRLRRNWNAADIVTRAALKAGFRPHERMVELNRSSRALEIG